MVSQPLSLMSVSGIIARLITVLMVGTLTETAWTVSSLSAAEPVKYSTQIAPLLRTYCVSCHSRVEAQNGLSLQAPDDILKGGENGVVFNDVSPVDGLLWKVLSSSGDDHMPPLDQPQLTPEELELVTTWLKEGATFDSRMAVLPTLPNVRVTAGEVRAPALTMAISSDAQSILVGNFKRIEQRSRANQQVVWSHPVPDGKVNSARLSSDGKRVLAATGTPGLSGRALEFAVGEEKLLREFGGHNDILYAAEWSPDGKIIATAGYDRKIILHNAETGEKLRELTGHNGAVFDLCFHPDGSLLASASADATIKIWHVSSGERFDTLSQPQSEQYAVAFSKDGRFVFGVGADSRIRKWQLVSLTAPQINPLVISRFAHEGAISKLELSGDGRFLVTAADNGSIKIWDSAQVVEQVAQDLEGDRVSSLVLDDSSNTVLIATLQGQQKSVSLPTQIVAASINELAPPVAMSTASEALNAVAEVEPNEAIETAQKVAFPAAISGTIHSVTGADSDVDLFRFEATQGQQIMMEVKAARDKSPLDSIVEVLTAQGEPILQAQLQAVRDSYFTFRGKDSETSDDFRMFNWQEMELNEYLYADGEVVKLWLYPRGPDSGFKVYPGFGSRQTYFGTTPSSHALQAPAFVVVPYAPDAVLKNTGLPVFPVYYENDDDSMRQWGKDSRLMFVAPSDGSYLVRLKDSRGFQAADFKYQLLLRAPQPDFTVAVSSTELSIHPGTGREISFTATRLDGYEGPIEILAENLPAGFSLSDPVVIQEEQRQAFATLIASPDAVAPTEEAVAKIQLKATARIGDQDIVHNAGGIQSLKLVEKPKIRVSILTAEQQAAGSLEHTSELTVWAGETVRAFLKVERLDHAGLVEFGKEDSGRNMPHGVFVDNIGLNGLMLLDGQNEREFFITTAKWVPESSRPFYLKSNVDGGITSLPVMLHIRHRPSDHPATAATSSN